MTIKCFLAALAAAFLLALLLPVPRHRRRHEPKRVADRLNLLAGETPMQLTDKLVLAIAPTAETASGPVAAPVTEVVWSVEPPEAGAVNTTSPDSLNAEFVPAQPGDFRVVVTAKNVKGDPLTDSFSGTVDVPVPVADKLNLSATVASA